MKLLRLATLIFVSSLIAACGDVDPNQPVTQKTFAQALKKFEKPDQEKIHALGGEAYFEGKTVNEVKRSLATDYMDKQKEDLIEHVKLFKSQNLEKSNEGGLTLEEVQSIFAKNDNELQTEVNEVAVHQKYLNAVREVERKKDPLGFITVAKLIAPCSTPELALSVAAMKVNLPTYNKEVKKRVASRECRRLATPKNRKTGMKYEILEVTTVNGQTVYKTPVGWLASSDVVGKSTKEELETLKDMQEIESRKLEVPPPQYYTAFRPLLNISPANPSRINLAEKAIAINAKNKGLTWDAAAKDFVLEQQDLSKAEYACLKDNSCDNLKELSMKMAGYVLAPDPNASTEVKPLPCEILAVSDCKFATPEAQKEAEEAAKRPVIRRRTRNR